MDFHYDPKQHPVSSFTGDKSVAVTISGDNSLAMTSGAARSLASILIWHADLVEGRPTGAIFTPLPTLTDSEMRMAVELNTGLAAVRAEEPDTEWGTDYWGHILSEPSEQHARNIAEHPNTRLYSRPPMGEWVEVPE